MGRNTQVIYKYFCYFLESGIIDNYQERIDKLREMNTGVTLEKFKLFYGEELGTEKFDKYRERQAYTNSLSYFIEKYGELAGKEKYASVNFKKSHTFESYLEKFGDEETALEKLNDYWNRTPNFTSNMAINLFEELDEKIKDLKLKTYFSPKTKEFGKYSKPLGKYVLYDFVIPELNICIEFNGDIFHANPNRFSENDCPNPFNKKMTAAEIWNYDKLKNDELIKLGFDIIIVWEQDFIKDKEKILYNITKYIKETCETYRRK